MLSIQNWECRKKSWEEVLKKKSETNIREKTDGNQSPKGEGQEGNKKRQNLGPQGNNRNEKKTQCSTGSNWKRKGKGGKEGKGKCLQNLSGETKLPTDVRNNSRGKVHRFPS